MIRKDLEEIRKDVGIVIKLGNETDMKVETLIEAKLAERVELKVVTEVKDTVKV